MKNHQIGRADGDKEAILLSSLGHANFRLIFLPAVLVASAETNTGSVIVIMVVGNGTASNNDQNTMMKKYDNNDNYQPQ